jgi:ABC-type multidrug transport system fused ATPase/permease subunit
LLGLVAPTSGRVFAPGQAAWVPQSPTIFRGTIADNVRLGAPAAPHERVRLALEDASAEFVHELPEGLATVVGDGGRVLSAGQCQRIALARAFVSDVRFVVLDEPTANLDPATVRAVADAIPRLAVSRSLLLITHSEELAQEADRIVRLEAGRIVPDTPQAPSREAVVA